MVRTAKTGPDALRIFQSQPTISLAILDWRMPGMTGEQVFDELAKKRPDVKVIVATGNDRSDVERAFAGRRVVRFLEKPFTPEVLVSAVRSTLAG